MASSIFPENIINNPIANSAKKRTRSTAYEVQKRSQRLYSRQLEGKTTRQLVIEHANIEQVSETTAWEDWNRVKKWNDEDWQKDRETLLPRLQAMRVRLFNKAVKNLTLGISKTNFWCVFYRHILKNNKFFNYYPLFIA